jgi:RND family efflux transporter MFP subunit
VGFDSTDDVRERLNGPTPDAGSLIGLAQRDLQLQQKELERLKGLLGGRMVSEVEIEQGERSVLAAENTVQTLRSQLEQAKLSLQRTEIQSPIDGVVVTDSVEQGDFVRRAAPLATIEDTSKVEVKCSLQMDELYWLWNQAASAGAGVEQSTPRSDYQIPRAPVTVIYRLEGREYQWKGVLSRYEGIGLDEMTRTVPCRVVVDAPREAEVRGAASDASKDSLTGPPALVRGMYVTVRIHADPKTALAEIREAAVRPGNTVWLVREGKLERIDVNLIRVVGEMAIVRMDGLSAGDEVVVTPLVAAYDGMPVREQSEE